ncbi:MAG: CDP-diacylglycerol--serine O-phosphatidyltransferase [Methylocystaceae bacterium]
MNFLPNAITLMNLAFGSLSLICTMNHDYHTAAIMIVLAVVMDSMDGRVARRLNASGDLGMELDSLCDLVSFGAAPAILYIAASIGVMSSYTYVDYLGTLIGTLYVLCGAYRLARFNVLNIHEYFVGIPITLAGFIVALIYLSAPHIPTLLMMAIMALLAYLMVSRITIPKL